MPEKIQFELVSPAKLLMSEPVDMVVVPGEDGNFGALPRHAPLISMVRPGVIEIHDEGTVRDRIFVTGGFAEVGEERCVVLAEEAIMLAEMDKVFVDQRLHEAERLVSEAQTEKERTAAEHKMLIAQAMVQALGTTSSLH